MARQYHIVERGSLLHEIFGRYIRSACLDHLRHEYGNVPSGEVQLVFKIAVRVILLHEGEPLDISGIVGPFRITDRLRRRRGDRTLCVFKAGWTEDRRHEVAADRKKLLGVPTDFACLTDRL